MDHFFIIFPVCALWWSLPVCKNSALPPAQPTVCQRLVSIPDSRVCHTSGTWIMSGVWALQTKLQISSSSLWLPQCSYLPCCFLLKIKMLRQEKEKFTQKWTMNVQLPVVQKTHLRLFLKITFSRFFYPMEDFKKKLLKLVGRGFIWFTLIIYFRLMSELSFKKTLYLS